MPQGLEGRLTVETVNADPEELLTSSYDKVAELINQYFK
jgi:hypothetical protein